MWGLNKKSNNKNILISLTSSEVRIFYVERLGAEINIISSFSVEYSSIEDIQDSCNQWIQSNKAKGLDCHWLLPRSHYRAIAVNPPKVSDAELDKSIKWLVKDQLEESIDSVLVTYYKPFVVEREPNKLTAVVVDKSLIESLIEITSNLNLDLTSIQISELAAGRALPSLQADSHITGLIDEDNVGLVYNFYVGRSLAFTRHIKGRYFPNHDADSLSLEDDDNEAKTDQFLLETQRTLDYCISQFFRKPVDRLILDAQRTDNTNLVDSLEQVAELPVDLIRLSNKEPSSENQEPSQPGLQLSIAEAGAVYFDGKSLQAINFYLPQYQPKPLEFSFKYAVGLTAASIIGLSFYGFVKEKEAINLDLQLNQQNKVLTNTQSSLQSLSKRLGHQSRAKDLDGIILKKQLELRSSKKLLEKVATKSPKTVVMFSEVLAALSTQQADSLWLTNINLSPTAINLAGQTTKPDSIPFYINSMSKNRVLASQFENLSIERNQQDNRLVDFEMSNGRYNDAR